MAEPLSALAHLPQAQVGSSTVVLGEVRPAAILQVAAWPETLAAVTRGLGEALGADAPRIGYSSTGPNGTMAAIGPGRYLIFGRSYDLHHRLQTAINSDVGAVTDLTHGRTVLMLRGEPATAILAKGLAIDLHPSAFPAGRIAQSMIHHIDVTVRRMDADQFELTVLRGFAEDFVEWLMDAGMEFGIAFIGRTE